MSLNDFLPEAQVHLFLLVIGREVGGSVGRWVDERERNGETDRALL